MGNCKDCQTIECHRWMSDRPSCTDFYTFKEDKTCYDCLQSVGEECGIDGHEIYHDSEICNSFEE